MFFLLDTNIVSELRKRERMNPGVLAWFEATYVHNLFLSVITIGEIVPPTPFKQDIWMRGWNGH
jgi:predicted nucleic acid-binding protein